ncbi:uncharacterized protein TNIN_387781 [Trichonephila inaurata madagascariensis]|uniref:Uncharacterized protein n=1 Tax=Trichonephila inaurata madagascariensis TaxID=2747483 RepID=A0A8X6YLP2_9ARAC|nr:uncharacterized protein TNIN_387781 [Trichonephila inaurata madagascariensis]
METKPQVDSSQKSPVSKSLPPTSSAETDEKKTSSNGIASVPGDKTVESKDKPCPTYQATSKPETQPASSVPDAKEPTDTKDHKTEASKTDEKLSHPIISVDIQKSMPYENKQAVPQESKKDSTSEAAVSPEMVASVVTTAVVNEAALAVSGTDGLVINGSKFPSDSSKVDTVVEQELNKFSEKINGKTELKSVEDSKALPNGDIDHSPVSDGNVEAAPKDLKGVSTKASDVNAQDKEQTAEKVVSAPDNVSSITQVAPPVTKETTPKAQSESQEKSISIGSCNGVPGIITVVGITKKDSPQTTSLEKTGLATDSKKSGDLEDKKVDEVDSKKQSDAGKDDKDQKSRDGSQIVESDSKTTGIILGEEREIDTKEKKTEVSDSTSKTDDTVVPSKDDNLTDSAKLQNSAHKITEKQKDVTPVSSVTKKEASEKEEETQVSEKKDIVQTQEKPSEGTVKKESIVKDASKTTIQQAPEKLKDEKETKEDNVVDESKKQIDSNTLTDDSKILADKIDTKGDIVAKEQIKEETLKDVSKEESVSSKEVKKVEDDVKDKSTDKKEIVNKEPDNQKDEMQVSDTSAMKKTDSVKAEISTLDAASKKEETKTEQIKAEDTPSVSSTRDKAAVETKDIQQKESENKLDKPSGDTCDMTLMMTSQILTEELLNTTDESKTTDEQKEKPGVQVPDTKKENESKSTSQDISDSKDSRQETKPSISAAIYSATTCDVGVGLDERTMIRVASGDGGEEEIDGQEATTEVEVTEEVQPGGDDSSHANLISNGTPSPGSASPTPSKDSSKPSSATSKKDVDSNKDDQSKPASAVSRSSIPEPIVYEPPERRKSAEGDNKKDVSSEKTEESEKEPEKEDKEAVKDAKEIEKESEETVKDVKEESKEEQSLSEEKAQEAEVPSEEKVTDSPAKDSKEDAEAAEAAEVKPEAKQDEKDIDSNIKEPQTSYHMDHFEEELLWKEYVGRVLEILLSYAQ